MKRAKSANKCKTLNTDGQQRNISLHQDQVKRSGAVHSPPESDVSQPLDLRSPPAIPPLEPLPLNDVPLPDQQARIKESLNQMRNLMLSATLSAQQLGPTGHSINARPYFTDINERPNLLVTCKQVRGSKISILALLSECFYCAGYEIGSSRNVHEALRGHRRYPGN